MKKNNGFTMVEMMFVVAIIGILAAIAWPSYQESVRKSRRTAAKSQLQEIQQNLERWYTLRNTYVGFTLGSLAVSPVGKTGSSVFYNLSFSAGPTVSTYTLQAVPANAQSTDRCGTFTIAQNGTKTPATPTDCW